MARLRWRVLAATTLLAGFTLCLLLNQAFSADKSNGTAANPVDSKAKAAEKKKAAKKRRQAADDSPDSTSIAQPGNSTNNTTGSAAPSFNVGGQSAGTSGQSGSSGNPSGLTPDSRTASVAPRKITSLNQPNAARKAGSKTGAKQSAAKALNAKNPLVQKVMQVQNRIHGSLVSQKGIYGTGTGLDADGNVVIRVYTTGADGPQIPHSAEGVPIVEVLTGPVRPCQGVASPGELKYKQPVPIGTSVYFANVCNSPSGIAAGTIGCRLTDNNTPPNKYILSSNHVLAGDATVYPSTLNASTALTVSNGLNWPPPDRTLNGNPSTFYPVTPANNIIPLLEKLTPISVTQPALIDRACKLPQPVGDTIGFLYAYIAYNDQNVPATPPPQIINGVVVPFPPYPKPNPNQVDAAIAQVQANAVDTGTPPDGYGVPTSNLIVASLGLNVQKYGRTTGQTFGTVLAVNVTIGNPTLNYLLPIPPTTGQLGLDLSGSNVYPITPTALIAFTNEVEIGPVAPSANFALGGDSGALVVDMTNNPVALVRAAAGTSVFCGDITEVLFELNTQANLPANQILSIDSGVSARFSSGDFKIGRGNPNSPQPPSLP